MKLSQYERDKIINALEKAWKYEFQYSLVSPLIVDIKEVTQYPSWSPYIYQAKTPFLISKMEQDFNLLLEKWIGQTVRRYPRLSSILNNRELFWIKVEETENPCALNVVFSPDIVLLSEGNSHINVFDWSQWGDDSLENAYDRLVKKGKI